MLAEAADRLALQEVVSVASFGDLVGLTAECDAVGVDIPIGLSESGRRTADVQARKLLGGARASSVFPSPIRAVLSCTGYREACDVSARLSGRMISKQTFALVPKIREANQTMTPALQRRVVEVHPEVSFRALNDSVTISVSKHLAAGVEYRESLLIPVFGEYLSLHPRPAGAQPHDLYDACAAAWTAWRVAQGTARRVPKTPEVDARGLRMEIVY